MKQEPVYIKINEYGNKRYYSDKEMTRLHRLDGPAAEDADGYKAWYIDGKRHRLDGPAVEEVDGYKAWYIDGQLHRLDGPAVERANVYKAWYIDGQRHRSDGPAIEYADGGKSWFINGEYLTEAEFLAATTPKVIHELTLDEIADRLGIAVESLKIVKEQQQQR